MTALEALLSAVLVVLLLPCSIIYVPEPSFQQGLVWSDLQDYCTAQISCSDGGGFWVKTNNVPTYHCVITMTLSLAQLAAPYRVSNNSCNTAECDQWKKQYSILSQISEEHRCVLRDVGLAHTPHSRRAKRSCKQTDHLCARTSTCFKLANYTTASVCNITLIYMLLPSPFSEKSRRYMCIHSCGALRICVLCVRGLSTPFVYIPTSGRWGQ